MANPFPLTGQDLRDNLAYVARYWKPPEREIRWSYQGGAYGNRTRSAYHPFTRRHLFRAQQEITSKGASCGIPYCLAYFAALYGWSNVGLSAAIHHFGFGRVLLEGDNKKLLGEYRAVRGLTPAHFPGSIIRHLTQQKRSYKVINKALRERELIGYSTSEPYREITLSTNTYDKLGGVWVWDVHLYHYAMLYINGVVPNPPYGLTRGAILPSKRNFMAERMWKGVEDLIDWSRVASLGYQIPPQFAD